MRSAPNPCYKIPTFLKHFPVISDPKIVRSAPNPCYKNCCSNSPAYTKTSQLSLQPIFKGQFCPVFNPKFCPVFNPKFVRFSTPNCPVFKEKNRPVFKGYFSPFCQRPFPIWTQNGARRAPNPLATEPGIRILQFCLF